MTEEPRPEVIDLAWLVQTRAAMRKAREGLDRPDIGDSQISDAQLALQRLSALLSEELWASVLVPREPGQAEVTVRQAVDAQQQEPVRQLLFDWLSEVTNHQRLRGVEATAQAGPDTPINSIVRMELRVFVEEAQPLATQPPPSPQDQAGRIAWVTAMKGALDKAFDVVTAMTVSAIYTVNQVQIAAQDAVLGTAALLNQGLSQVGSSLPSLIALTTVATHAAMGIKRIREAGHWSNRPTQSAEPNDHPRVRPDLTTKPGSDVRDRLDRLRRMASKKRRPGDDPHPASGTGPVGGPR